ncbi:chloride channel protein [Methylocapsa sp. D3K7]|uniref:chloride channel protein n=1 Tax=Methylocapsa sp. D3K7 TaxID=3041435 RepID=UPI00244E8196|nr:chloride channel protein [Methylocapsa sp. D3K7]WGJ13986.1 chloride channel protein [Methylocapsa sp. D3K7]
MISRFDILTLIPLRIRGLVRRHEVGFIGLAGLAGGIAGLSVAALLGTTNFLHRWLFGHPHLSSLTALDSPFLAFIPLMGGLLLGISGIYVRKWMPRRPVDPIEANALQGGRMSIKDSLVIAAQTVVSNGFGASVGLEAAYTQMGSGLASWLGTAFRLRRGDMRTLVACGSAGAIAAAFGAPLTGAFYGFELILGTYTPFGLAPVGAAAVCGVLVSKAFGASGEFMNQMTLKSALSPTDMGFLLVLGIICALFGIRMMRAVTSVERFCAGIALPSPLQPMFGGLLVGLLALVTPHVLASGHGALFELFGPGSGPSDVVLITLLLKALASVISLGTGFRGGLFFASLYLGGMIGLVFFYAVQYFDPSLAPDMTVCTLIGMSALAVAIIGAPMAMSFLALETTGDFPLGLVMLAVASVVSIIVRRTFGYSFATWRLHVRGESIRSAQDVGWMRDLTAGRLMRTDVPKASLDMPLAAFIKAFPAQSANQWVVLTGPSGGYAGLLFVPDVHLAGANGSANTTGLGQLARSTNIFLQPEMNIKLAVQYFEQNENEALAVVDNEKDRHVVGLLTEAHVLRRYTDELDKAHRELSGESWVGGN